MLPFDHLTQGARASSSSFLTFFSPSKQEQKDWKQTIQSHLKILRRGMRICLGERPTRLNFKLKTKNAVTNNGVVYTSAWEKPGK